VKNATNPNSCKHHFQRRAGSLNTLTPSTGNLKHNEHIMFFYQRLVCIVSFIPSTFRMKFLGAHKREIRDIIEDWDTNPLLPRHEAGKKCLNSLLRRKRSFYYSEGEFDFDGEEIPVFWVPISHLLINRPPDKNPSLPTQ
jgi:hypothetical protein